MTLDQCFSNFRPLWSSDGRFLLSDRVVYEPVQSFLFDPSIERQQGTRLPLLALGWAWQGSKVCAHNGDGYSNGPTESYMYDVVTGIRTPIMKPPSPLLAGVPVGCEVNGRGELAVTWDIPQALNRSYSGESVLRMFAADGTIVASTRAVGYLRAWVSDGSGVILLDRHDGISGGHTLKPRYFFMDRAGDLWNLDLGGDALLAALP